MSFGRAWLVLTMAALGCRASGVSEDEPVQAHSSRPASTIAAPTARPTGARPSPPAAELSAYLEGAVLEASYDSTTLARLLHSLPRPSLTPSPPPLVGVFGGVLDHFMGDPATRLEALGLAKDEPLRMSIRALDGRAAAVRKLLGELTRDAEPTPELLARVSSEGRTLGVHLRASLPTSDRARLLRALELLTITDDDSGIWATACEGLARVALCSGRPRLLMWARDEGEDRLRVDVVYLFYEGSAATELERALARADGWPTRVDAPGFETRQGQTHAPMQLLIHAGPTLALLEAEALADAVVRFADVDDELDYAAYLDRERALRELYPEQRVFEGVGLDMRYDDAGLAMELRWLAAAPVEAARLSVLFAPVVERGTLPVIHGDCEMAQACVRIGGLSSVTRFAPLAQGAFADTTGATRVLRQAGERGQILLALSSWPNLLGTAGAMAAPAHGQGMLGQGMMSKAQTTLINDSYGLGLFLLELGDETSSGSFGERFVGYLRVGPEALEALRPAAALVGLSPRPVELDGVEAAVERGGYEDMSVYIVDEDLRPGGFGGWLIAADDDARVGWLLETPRQRPAPAELDPAWYLRVAALGPIAAREQVDYSDNPPVREWLDAHGLELRARFTSAGPRVEILLSNARPAGQ